MASPETIHTVLNAADFYPRFVEAGIPAMTGDTITAEQVGVVLGRLVRRMHRLRGWLDTEDPLETPSEVNISVRDTNPEGGLLVVNHDEPPFTDWYKVAEQPPPTITAHGDYTFDLQRVEAEA